jgi:hypothetical protein
MAERRVVPAVVNVSRDEKNLTRQLVGAYNQLALSFNALLAEVQEGSPDYSEIVDADVIGFIGEEELPS